MRMQVRRIPLISFGPLEDGPDGHLKHITVCAAECVVTEYR